MLPDIENIVKRNLAKPEKLIESIEADAGKVTNAVSHEKILRAMGVPKRFVRELRTLEARPVIQAVEHWHGAKERWSLFMSGNPDVGKSFAAAYWLALVAAEKYSHVTNVDASWRFWYQANDLTHLDRSEYRRLWTAPYLVIDDLGAEYHSDSGYFQSVLYSIISHRYDDELPTVITCNLNGKQTKERYPDERLLRRIRPPHAAGGWFESKPKLRSV